MSFAEKSFAYRETSRNLALIEDELIPKARQSLETVRAGYRAGTMDFSTLTDAERMLLDLQLEAAEARTEREIALAELSLMVAGVPPAGRAAFVERPLTLSKFYELEIETDLCRDTAGRSDWHRRVHRRLLAPAGNVRRHGGFSRRKRSTPAACTRGSSRIIRATARFAA